MVLNELLLDCGNTAIKYAYEGKMGVFGSFDSLAVFLETHLPENVYVSDVGGRYEEIARACSELKLSTHRVVVEDDFNGVKLVYNDISKLGVDRWLAMLGAYSYIPGFDTVVVDVGTAVKIDIIDHEGRHLGGSISPGMHLSAQSLNRHTALLPEVPLVTSGKLGTDTYSCIQYGVIIGVVALIKYTVLKFGSESKLIITGGDASIITPFLDFEFTHKPNLVLDGLAVYRRCL